MTNEKPPGAREIKRQQTYQRIFDASIEEFCRVGADEARVDQICKQVGVAKGTFFFHFPTKDHVLLARQRQISERMAKRIATELHDAPSANTFLSRLTGIIVKEHEAVGNLELVRQINLAIVRKSGSQNLNIGKTAFGFSLIEQIEHLQDAGVLNGRLDATELADCIRLSLFGFLVTPQTSFDQIRPKIALWAELMASSLEA